MVGTQIALLRKKAGMTQAELAQHIHVSPSTIGMYEQGRRQPAIPILSAISKEFNVSIDYLVFGTAHSRNDIKKILSAIKDCYERDLPTDQKKSYNPTRYRLAIELLDILFN